MHCFVATENTGGKHGKRVTDKDVMLWKKNVIVLFMFSESHTI